MAQYKKFFLSLSLCFVLFFMLSFSSVAESKIEKLYDKTSGIFSVSYRGDIKNYPENSLPAVLSAEDLGADAVSVSVDKTKDGVFVLAEKENQENIFGGEVNSISLYDYAELKDKKLLDSYGKKSDYTLSTLEELLNATDESLFLILDINESDKQEVFDLLLLKDAEKRVALRYDSPAKEIVAFTENYEERKPLVIGIYKGNIIWNAVSHIETLSEIGMPAVLYRSKNYFAVSFASYLSKRYYKDDNVRAMVQTFNMDFSGQRDDGATSWDELVERGFSVIETNNIASLCNYTAEVSREKQELLDLISKTSQADFSSYSSLSSDNLRKALEASKNTVEKPFSSLFELQGKKSKLLFALSNLNHIEGKETGKGAVTLSAGKIIAIVSVGLLILSAQIFVHKMQSEKKRQNKHFR